MVRTAPDLALSIGGGAQTRSPHAAVGHHWRWRFHQRFGFSSSGLVARLLQTSVM
jgi:hypothetical protein